MNEPAAPAAPAAPAPAAAPAPGVGLAAPLPGAPAAPVAGAPAAPAVPVGLAAQPAAPAAPAQAGWLTGVSDEFRAHPALQSITDINGMVKSYIHGQQMIGADKIVKVGADADATAKADFFKELGWGGAPADAAGYGLSIEGIEGFGDLNPIKDFMGDIMHKHGIGAEAGKGIFTEFLAHEQSQHAEDLKAINQDKQLKLTTLREELGPSFDHVMLKAQAAAQKATPDGSLMKLLTENHLEAEPSVIKMLASLGDATLGDNFNPGDLTREFTTTPQQAQSEIAKLQADPDFMKQYMTKGAPGQKEALKKMTDLFALANPEPAS